MPEQNDRPNSIHHPIDRPDTRQVNPHQIDADGLLLDIQKLKSENGDLWLPLLFQDFGMQLASIRTDVGVHAESARRGQEQIKHQVEEVKAAQDDNARRIDVLEGWRPAVDQALIRIEKSLTGVNDSVDTIHKSLTTIQDGIVGLPALLKAARWTGDVFSKAIVGAGVVVIISLLGWAVYWVTGHKVSFYSSP